MRPAALALIALIAASAALPLTAGDRPAPPGTLVAQGSMPTVGGPQGDSGAAAQGTGVVNSVDAAAGVVNITHGPIPALNWPDMTMDLPVTEDVDLGSVQPGDAVRFRVELGTDQVYRVTAIEPAP
jgi:Cu(I)/Ag(I) efflux system periplasmic protein CusF